MDAGVKPNPSIYPVEYTVQTPLNRSKMAVFDIDDTLFNSSQRVTNAIRAGVGPTTPYTGDRKSSDYPKGKKAFMKFFNDPKQFRADSVTPGAVEYVRSLANKGYTIAYCSGRTNTHIDSTIEHLKQSGFPVFKNSKGETLVYLKPMRAKTAKFKYDTMRRLQASYTIDYFFDDLRENREVAHSLNVIGVYDLRDRLGIMPNPSGYGPKWEVGSSYDLTPEDEPDRGIYMPSEEAQARRYARRQEKKAPKKTGKINMIRCMRCNKETFSDTLVENSFCRKCAKELGALNNPHKIISQIEGGHPQGKPGMVFHLTNVPEGYREAAGCMVQRASDGKVLFLRRSKKETSKHGMYEFPGGKLEEGETAKEAALIETKEEAGLDVKIIRQLNSHVDHTKKKVYHCFLAVPKKGARVTLSFEHDDYKWCSLNKKWSNKKLSHHARYMINQMHDVRSNGLFGSKKKQLQMNDSVGTQVAITNRNGISVQGKGPESKEIGPSVSISDTEVTLKYPGPRYPDWVVYQIDKQPQQKQPGPVGRVYFNRSTGELQISPPNPQADALEKQQRAERQQKRDSAGPAPSPVTDPKGFNRWMKEQTRMNPSGTYHKYTAKVHKILEVEGGAAGLSALKPAFPKKTSKKKAESMLAKMAGVVQHDDGDYILVTGMSNPPVKSKILPIMSGEPSGKHKKLGAVFAEVVIGRNIVKDVGEVVQGIYRGLIGGRTSMAEKRMAMGVASMQKELSDRAQALGGNAVCNLKIDYEMIQGTATISIIATADAIKMTRPPKNNPRKPLDGMEDKKMKKAKQAYKKFHGGKEPTEMVKETIDVGDVWYALGPCWSIGYKSPKETGEDDQKYIHHTNEDSKDGNYPMMYATMPENGEPMIVIKGGSMKIGMRDGLAWLID